jgi:hypothetical protein
MKVMISKLLKMVFTPKMKKQMFIALGDHLVKSTKNKLDDAIWAQVKSKI